MGFGLRDVHMVAAGEFSVVVGGVGGDVARVLVVAERGAGEGWLQQCGGAFFRERVVPMRWAPAGAMGYGVAGWPRRCGGRVGGSGR